MERLLWSKRIFTNKLIITRGNEQIGVISWNNFFSSNAIATLNGRGFILNRDYFLSKLEIQDANSHDVLGTVMINMFSFNSDLVINRKRFELEIKNFWQSRWCWKFNGQEIITFQSNELLSKDRGEIEVYSASAEEVEILILLGLFVRSQLILFLALLLLIILFVIIS
jgi:hypothetical protein